MGVYAKVANAQGITTYLYTSDQDAFQLVNDLTFVVSAKKGHSKLVIFDRAAVFEKCGVYPEQIIDFKALKGDTSDNIPGVKGVGDKTAAKLIAEYTHLDHLYDNIESISSAALKDKLIRSKDDAYMSQFLATIKTDVVLPYSLEDWKIDLDWPELQKLFIDYEFKNLLKKYSHHFDQSLPLMEAQSASSKDPEFECIIIKTQEQCQAMLPALHDGFTFDVETTSVTIQDAQLLGLAICAADDRAYYIDFSHNLLQTDSQSVSAPLFSVGESSSDLILYEASPLLTVLKPLFEDEGVQKCAHNAKYDIQVLASYGVQVRGIVFDTMLAASLLFPHEPIGLKAIVEKHCGVVMTSYEEVLGTEATLQTVSLQQVSTYAAADAYYTRKCQLLFLGLLEDKQLTELFFTIECPLVYPLAAMETAGVTLNVTGLNELRQTLLREQSNYEVQIYDYSKRPFNINSTKQLAVVLFDDLGLPVVKKTKTGRSTDVSVLEELQGKHPITELLLQYRTNEKLLNTYINALPHLIHPKTGRIHTTFNQAVVITGRLSSSAPNLQNIPIRSKRGLEIRKVFIPRSKGRQLLALDYSQIELRLMAHFSGDKCMIDAFNAGEDIHKSTASIIFNCPIEEVTSEQRYNAKAVNFGIIYGISPFGLAKNLNCSRQDAKQLIDDYFAKFPKILEFIDATINIAKKDGFVRTAFGRRRPDRTHSSTPHLLRSKIQWTRRCLKALMTRRRTATWTMPRWCRRRTL